VCYTEESEAMCHTDAITFCNVLEGKPHFHRYCASYTQIRPLTEKKIQASAAHTMLKRHPR
jgi:hypothetical protein